jgi:DNA-binding MarR family transcriptional regulator
MMSNRMSSHASAVEREHADSPRPRVLRRVRQVHLLAQAYADRVAREHGLTMQQWELLVRLRRAGGAVDQRDLPASFGLTAPTLTALIDAVEARGLVQRCAHPSDRRQRRIVLTAAGERLVCGMPHLGREVGRRMAAGFSDEELAQLAALLERAARNLELAP